MRIPSNRPLAARRVMQALSSDAKLRLLRVLARGPASPASMARELDMALSVVTEHLRDLEAAGLVRTAGYARVGRGRPAKLYALSSPRVVIEVDLPLYAEVGSEDRVASLALEYVRRKMEGPGLPASPSALDIAETLGIDVKLASIVLGYVRPTSEDLMGILEGSVMDVLRERGGADVGELSDSLNVDRYWIVAALKRLSEKGLIEIRRGIARPIV